MSLARALLAAVVVFAATGAILGGPAGLTLLAIAAVLLLARALAA